MSKEFEEYEKEIMKNKEENKKYLEGFIEYLNSQKLSKKTINKHYNNVDLYINDYLNYYEPNEMPFGCYSINSYLGDWYIRKCLFASKTSIKESAASIKKFYKCMLEKRIRYQ